MDFDIRIAVFLGATLSLLIGLLLALVVRDFPESVRASLTLWARGTILLPLGMLLFELRGVWPDAVTVLLANLLLVFAFGYYTRAMLGFLALPQRPTLAWVLAGLLLPGLWWFNYVEPQPGTRAALVSAALAVEVGILARVMWRIPPQERSRGALANIALFTFAAGFLAYWSVHYLIVPQALFDPSQASAMQFLGFTAGAVLPLVGSFGFLLLCVDRARRELEITATTDYLTGLANRRSIEACGEQAFASARRSGRALSVLVFDLDHFKRINDAYGHAAGDAALREIAMVLKSSARTNESPGRLGGEEFVMVLYDIDIAAAKRVAERMRHGIGACRIRAGDRTRHLTASVGVATICAADMTFGDILQRADRAMYAAKKRGRDCVVLREHRVRESLVSAA